MENHFIATINSADIVAVDRDGQIFVPIKPICAVLGINYTTQLEKLKTDPTFSGSTVPLRGIVARDGKEREMVCLPYMLVFFWLGTINPANVSDKARQGVVDYRLECARVLYEHFTSAVARTIEINNMEIKLLREINAAKAEEEDAKAQRRKLEQSLEKLRQQRLDPQPPLF